MILCLRVNSHRYLLEQRALDRCVYRELEWRCSSLTRLSKLNATLSKLTTALAAIELAKTAGSVIPVVDIAVAGIGQASAEILRVMIQGLVKGQDALIAVDQARALTTIRCGLPRGPLSAPEFSRPQTWETFWTQTPPPLAWEKGPIETQLDFQSWSLRVRSFGHCRPEQPPESLLSGESYAVSMRLARSRSKPSSSSPWP